MPFLHSHFSLAVLFAFFTATGFVTASAAEPTQTNPDSINILLITSGCCHDYDFQTKAMQLAFENRGVAAVWTVVNDGGDASLVGQLDD